MPLSEVLILQKTLLKIIVRCEFLSREKLQKVFQNHLNPIGNSQKLLSDKNQYYYILCRTVSYCSLSELSAELVSFSGGWLRGPQESFNRMLVKTSFGDLYRSEIMGGRELSMMHRNRVTLRAIKNENLFSIDAEKSHKFKKMERSILLL